VPRRGSGILPIPRRWRRADASGVSTPLRAALIAALALGCASPGRLLPEERVALIRPGQTSQEQIHAWFGSPDAMGGEAGGESVWAWDRSDRAYARGSLGRWLFAPLAHFFEAWVFYPPSPRPPEDLLRDRLEVAFDADGLVTRFDFLREAPGG
jgi:hypothetical protein